MRFPEELWPDATERQMVRDLVEAFADLPIILTDKLANSVYFSPSAEVLCGERAEEVVNRLSLSLLGFGERDRVAPGLVEGLLGEGPAWRGVVNLTKGSGRVFVEASAIRRGDHFICGIVRIGAVQ